MDAEKKNYYEVLDIEPFSSPAQIETAYIRARNAYSGDSVALYSLMTKDECSAILSQIEEAYSVIGFPEKRREYDRLRGFNQGTAIHSSSAYTSQNGGPMHTVHMLEDRPRESLTYEDFGSNLIEAKVSKITAQKKFGLEFTEDPEMEKRIQECAEFTGPFLKEIREYKNVPVERLSEMTRIAKSHIVAIENEDLTRLPAEVYVRGYVYQYAKVLKLNPEAVATSFLTYFKKLKSRK